MKIESEIIELYRGYFPKEQIEVFLKSQTLEKMEKIRTNKLDFVDAFNQFKDSSLHAEFNRKPHFHSANSTTIKKSPFNITRPQNQIDSPISQESPKMVGLLNIGNTCYFNSLLQTLFMIDKFRNNILVLQVPEQTDATLSPRIQNSLILLKALKALFEDMVLGKSPVLNPSEVLDNVYNEFNEKVLIGKQQDMVEYLMVFIEQTSVGVQHLLEPSNEPPSKTQNTNNKESLDNLGNLTLANTEISGLPKKSNFVHELFKGKLIWALETKVGEKQKDSFEDFGPLIVDIDEKNLQEALASKLRYELSGFKPDVS